MDAVKSLRDKTGVSIMQCRKALEEAEGDMDKAEVILRKRSGAAAMRVIRIGSPGIAGEASPGLPSWGSRLGAAKPGAISICVRSSSGR